ncbi:hypothetical protein LBMAG35_08790 [Chlorobiota bacterium]|nr:hypothetical protein LBMAG35_08790 [Chlorobiota bacterium]
MSQGLTTVHTSRIQSMRFHVMAHEVFWGLITTLVQLWIAWFAPELLYYSIIIQLLLMMIVMHPSMIGIQKNTFEQAFPATLFRGFLFGFCYGFLYDDVQMSILQSVNMLLPLTASIFFSAGYFAEFMRRRGFSDWINVICSSIIMCSFIFILLSEIPSLRDIILLASSITFAIAIRLQSKNVWDAILVLLFLHIISSNAETLFHLFTSLS